MSAEVNGHTEPLATPYADRAMPLIDLNESDRFLSVLDPEAEEHTFQTFQDSKTSGKDAFPAQVFSGSLTKCSPDLEHASARGFGVFVTVNTTDLRGRKTQNIIRVRAVFVDIDDDPTGEKRAQIMRCKLQPHIVVDSSPGKCHAFWRVYGLPLNEFRQVQKAVIARFGGDISVHDLPRVMRLPGFPHQKHLPTAVCIAHSLDRAAYSAEEIRAEFCPFVLPVLEGCVSLRSDRSAATLEGMDANTIRDLRSALFWMCADERDLWIRMGCALRELGDLGRDLWMDWSATSRLHNPAADAETWDGLGHDRTSYRAVFAEAHRRGWINPRADSREVVVTSPVRSIVTIDAAALLTHKFPPRDMLLSPWLQSQALTMIYAWRGVGKTHVALGIGHALATGGSFLGWKAACPVPVVYLDGEMPGIALSERVSSVVISGEKAPQPGFLRFVTPDLQQDGVMPNLADRAGQYAIEAILGDAKVIIVDNLSCLARGGKENEAEGWLPLAEWSLRMRSTGRSVIFIHHAGKGGQQRGTSKREDLLDTVIALKRPSDYRAEQGARFEVHFEKARALYGQDVAALEATLETQPDFRQVWTSKTVDAVADAQMIELADLGLSQSDIARELGCHRSTILRALRKAEDEGRYTPKPAQQPGKKHARS